ncbi:MAG: hypothetical protein ACQEP2_08170 [Actinomycetota bacterium]
MRVFGDPIIIGDDLAGNDYEIIEFNGKHLKTRRPGCYALQCKDIYFAFGHACFELTLRVIAQK